jgi:predicted AlkP superfamily phosphohydrolase/phosphomutase
MDILRKCNKYGFVLSTKQKKKLNLNSNFYGEEIFWCKPGVILYPNFFNNNLPKGMHGYNLSDPNEKAFFLVNKKTTLKAKTEDLFPTLLSLMGIKNNSKIDGKSILN